MDGTTRFLLILVLSVVGAAVVLACFAGALMVSSGHLWASEGPRSAGFRLGVMAVFVVVGLLCGFLAIRAVQRLVRMGRQSVSSPGAKDHLLPSLGLAICALSILGSTVGYESGFGKLFSYVLLFVGEGMLFASVAMSW